MTIHKSKGLEFDTVIVPSLQRPSRPQSAELLLWYERLSSEGEPHLLMSPITSSGREKDSVYVHLATQEKRRDQNEACRLLYVACTRAKKNLHLSGILKRSKKKTEEIEGFGFTSPVKSSLLATIWQAVERKVRLQESETISDEKNTHENLIEKPKYLRRLKTQWQMPSLEGGHLLDQYVPFFEHDNTLFSNLGQYDMTRRHVGTLVHRLLKDLNVDKINQWQECIAEQDKKRWINYLKRMGVAKDKLNLALSRTEAAIDGIVKNNEIHWLFQMHHPRRETEFAISMHGSEGVQHHVVDLFIDDGNCTWVIDFKTSFPEENEDKGVFISRELAAYRKVMLEYQRAVMNMGYKQVKLALYFPLLCEWHEYDM